MTGCNLPPGCTQADIDRAMGCEPRCSECGKETASDDLELVYWKGRKLWICPDCTGPPDDYEWDPSNER